MGGRAGPAPGEHHDLVVDGVVTPHVLQLPREVGCDLVQGYRLDRPLPENQVLDPPCRRGLEGPAKTTWPGWAKLHPPLFSIATGRHASPACS